MSREHVSSILQELFFMANPHVPVNVSPRSHEGKCGAPCLPYNPNRGLLEDLMTFEGGWLRLGGRSRRPRDIAPRHRHLETGILDPVPCPLPS